VGCRVLVKTTPAVVNTVSDPANPDLPEILRCAVLLVLIFACWFLLSGRIIDASQVTFIYRDF